MHRTSLSQAYLYAGIIIITFALFQGMILHVGVDSSAGRSHRQAGVGVESERVFAALEGARGV